MPPAPAISIKNKHLLVIYAIPARGFTAAVSVFRGTPPTKPLNCKIVPNHSGARHRRPRWAEPTREEFSFPGDHSRLAATNLIDPSLNNSWFSFISGGIGRFQETKNPAYTR